MGWRVIHEAPDDSDSHQEQSDGRNRCMNESNSSLLVAAFHAGLLKAEVDQGKQADSDQPMQRFGQRSVFRNGISKLHDLSLHHWLVHEDYH